MKTYQFEGEYLTVRQIAERVPALSESTIRKHLAAGRNTRQAMLSVPSASSANGRKAAARNNPQARARRSGGAK